MYVCEESYGSILVYEDRGVYVYIHVQWEQ